MSWEKTSSLEESSELFGSSLDVARILNTEGNYKSSNTGYPRRDTITAFAIVLPDALSYSIDKVSVGGEVTNSVEIWPKRYKHEYLLADAGPLNEIILYPDRTKEQ